ncbi:glycoside hydrolase domain-containing protein [Streptomyces sp. NBC_00091]|uniref:glycoside hydrolase domain-containing protein n=1 Tax=Streptomyces sp. NBC_00091 TaxID=2975648 RepID=UPI00224FC9EF|nr:glycoside hydrolase domain-containing protein [Streptomyces sp. NBC_00091]MCX5378914.1 DUF1906 domain-containing protein [Streptomyces sp. NBC_00091]
MPSRTLLRCLLGAALLMPLSPAVATATPTAAPAATAAGDGPAVDYRGLRLALPAGWRVVDLDRDPAACLRLDRPTLYLGHAGTQAECSGRRAVATRADTLHLEPLDGAPPRADVPTLTVDGGSAPPPAEGDSGEVRYALRGPGVMATLSYGAEPDAVRELLARAVGVPGHPGAAEPVAATVAAAPPRSGRQAFTGQAFTGQGFDACTAPPQRSMDAWRAGSPFGAIGVYIGGRARACAQPQLTAAWIRRQAEAGWHLMPIWVGPQPWHSATTGLSTDPSEANEQGREAADGAAQAARSLGLAEGTPLYNDLEHYGDRTTWDPPVVAYLTAWTVRLHELGYRSAAYVSASSGAKALSAHHHQAPQAMPDVLWVAQWNGAASVTDADMGLPQGKALWAGPRRAHQFRGDHDASYGGVTINIDRSWVDVDPAVLAPVAPVPVPAPAPVPTPAAVPRFS